MRLFLWGQRASEFDADLVYEMGQDNPVVGVFVGTLVKSFRGSFFRVYLIGYLLYCNMCFVLNKLRWACVCVFFFTGLYRRGDA